MMFCECFKNRIKCSVSLGVGVQIKALSARDWLVPVVNCTHTLVHNLNFSMLCFQTAHSREWKVETERRMIMVMMMVMMMPMVMILICSLVYFGPPGCNQFICEAAVRSFI